jgi:hypothetical protein
LLDDLAQGLQLTKDLLCHPVPPIRVGSGAITSECEEWRVSIIPQLEPLLPQPFHRFGHEDVKIRIDTLPGLNVDKHSPL